MSIFQFKTTPKPPPCQGGGRGRSITKFTFFLLAKPPAPRGLLRKASEQFSKLKLDIPKLGLGNEEGFETHSNEEGFSIIYF